MLRISHAGLTDQGRVREQNEDRWLADGSFGLFVVADGMGGERGGGLAADIVVATLPLLLSRVMAAILDLNDPLAAEQVREALSELSQHVRRESQGHAGLDGMGATVVMALVRKDAALIGHMGDSRAYLLREGRLEQLTRDHSLVQLLLDCGEITPAEAVRHPSRGQLTRYNGMTGEPLPEARLVELRLGDRLLLCSDGLTGMLSDDEVLSILAQNPAPATCCDRLVSAANAAGGRDNVTALVIVAGDDSVQVPSSDSNSRTSLSTSASEPT